MGHPQPAQQISEGTELHSSVNRGGYESLVQDNPDGQKTVSYLVRGVHCAGCIQKIESTLLSLDPVQGARLNFSTGRLNVAWNGPAELANDFAAKIEGLGYGVHPYSTDAEKSESEKEWKFLLMCLGVSGFAMGNIMLLSVGLWITSSETMGMGTREFMHWFSALIGIPAVLFAGQPFFRSALTVLKNRQTNMDVPISLALLLAVGMSISELLNNGEHVYFDSAVMLMFFLLIGRVLDFRARRTARSSATDLMSTLSGFATVIDGTAKRKVPIKDLREGMTVLVAMGEKIPIDGVVAEGESSIDTSLVTGETNPRNAAKGAEVFAGTFNLDAPLTITVARAAEDSLLADIVRLMERAEQGQAKYVRLADRAARLYTPVVHTLALAAFILWWAVLGADWQDALLVAVTVLIITCPCALGLAVPVVQVLASGLMMKKGILVKAGDAFERLAGIDMALFDKTGTLTMGKPKLVGEYEAQDLQLAASLASHSRHPLSQALTKAYSGDLLTLEHVREEAGAGMQGNWNGQLVQLGKRNWCGDGNAPAYDGPEIWLSADGRKIQFKFSDHVKDDAADVIKRLNASGIKTILLSGDRENAVQSVAKETGIEEAHGNLTPPEKFDFMESQKKSGHTILMVGDGLNDAPVLSGADISMAPGTAIDMAQNAADIVFMGDVLSPVLAAHDIAVRTQKLVKQNFILAVLYNLVAVPLAFMGLVTPMIAAIAMSGSSLLVIANSFRLKLRT